MHCAKCGYNNLTNARVCAKCGTPLASAPKRPARARGERKTVQLPSYEATHEKAQQSKPQARDENERPWEARIPTREKRAAQRDDRAAQATKMQQAQNEQLEQNQVEQPEQIKQVERTQAEQPEQVKQIEQARAEQSKKVEQVEQEYVEQAKDTATVVEPVEQPEKNEQDEDENLQKYRGRFATHVPAKKQPKADGKGAGAVGRAAAVAAGSLASEAGSIKTPTSDTASSSRVDAASGDTKTIKIENTELETAPPKKERAETAETRVDEQAQDEASRTGHEVTEQITEQITVESTQGKDDIPAASRAATVVIPASAAVAARASDATVKMPEVKDGTEKNAAAATATAAAAAAAVPGKPDDSTIVVKRTSPTQRHAPKKESNAGKKAIGVVAALALLACLGIGGWYFTHGSSAKNTVSFDTNGGSSISQQYITENGQLQQPMSPTREGYKFEGWYLDAAYNEPAKFPLTITKDITLYAKWVPESQTGTSTSASTSSSSSSSAASGQSTGSASGVVSGGGTSSGGTSSGGSSGGGYAPSGSGSGSDEGGSGGGSGGSGGGSGSDTGDVTTSISVIAADGSTLSGEVHLHDGYVIPDSSDRVYSIDELRALNLSDADLCIAWNEPFARLGHDFDNPGLQDFFDNRSWYSNSFRKASLPPNSAAEINVSRLQELARENESSAAWLNLRTY